MRGRRRGKEEGGGEREGEGGGVTSIQCLSSSKYITWKTACTILTAIHAGVSLGLGLRQEHMMTYNNGD